MKGGLGVFFVFFRRGRGERDRQTEKEEVRVHNGQSALEESRLTGESRKVGPRRGTAAEY